MNFLPILFKFYFKFFHVTLISFNTIFYFKSIDRIIFRRKRKISYFKIISVTKVEVVADAKKEQKLYFSLLKVYHDFLKLFNIFLI